MATYSNGVLDAQLDALKAGDELHICSAEPATFAEATGAHTLGVKAGPSYTANADASGGGREMSLQPFTDGATTANGMATHYALVDTGSSTLLATLAIPTAKAVNSGGGTSDSWKIDTAITFRAQDPQAV